MALYIKESSQLQGRLCRDCNKNKRENINGVDREVMYTRGVYGDDVMIVQEESIATKMGREMINKILWTKYKDVVTHVIREVKSSKSSFV